MQAKTSVNTARGRLLALRARIQTDFFRLQQYCNVRVVDVSPSTCDRCPRCRLLATSRLPTLTSRASVLAPAHTNGHRSQVSTDELPTHRAVPLCADSRL